MPQKILLGSQHSSGRGMRVVQMEDLGKKKKHTKGIYKTLCI